ncbi:MAG TPA: hypothetical protein VND98_09590 [Solirubrobacterales bacterium]|nr:hypothetical protein [Solirubrobacterales bacterium]
MSEVTSPNGMRGRSSSAEDWGRAVISSLIVVAVAAVAGIIGSAWSIYLAVGFAILGLAFLLQARRSARSSKPSGKVSIKAALAALILLALATVTVIIKQL